jgi:iron complex outermembrane receptor protein
VARWDATDGSKQDAAFGQVEYDLIDNLTLIGGVRAGQERINYSFIDYTVAAGATNSWAGSNSDTYYTYKVGPQYQLTDNIMLFATRSTGHKGQTYDLTTGFNSLRAQGGPVLPETSSDYEIGAKMQFFGRRLTINPTIFTTTYDNFQAQGTEILPDGTTNFRLANVGQARTRGFESDNSFKVSQDLTIGVSGSYLDAHILSFRGAQCFPGQTAAQGCVGSPTHQDLSGAALPDAPKWKFTSDATYIHGLGFIPWDGVYRASYTYTSKVNYALTQDPVTVQQGYGLFNISAGMRDQGERYDVTLFVNNLFDKHYHQNIGDNFSTFGSHLAVAAQIPRDFSRYGGIRLNAKF